METIINNKGEGGGSGAGIIVGVVIALVLIALFFVFALPALRNQKKDNGGINVDVNLPSGNDGGGTPSGGNGDGGI